MEFPHKATTLAKLVLVAPTLELAPAVAYLIFTAPIKCKIFARVLNYST